MNNEIIVKICEKHKIQPIEIKRFSTGYGNYVFYVKSNDNEYVIRCNNKPYRNTIKSLKKLNSVDIPISKLLFKGRYKRVYYMVCSYIQGDDLGKVYHTLSCDDKKAIAKQVAEIQNNVSQLSLLYRCNLYKWIEQRLQRARDRISQNGYFDTKKVDKLEELLPQFKDYFNKFKPVPYLDDISTKNLLIYNNRVSGIIDTDWIGYGDSLTFVALTNIALLDMQYDTDYVGYLLEEMNVQKEQYKVFLFYSLMYCVDFMGEKGTTFNGNKVEVDENTVKRLNKTYELLCEQLLSCINQSGMIL